MSDVAYYLIQRDGCPAFARRYRNVEDAERVRDAMTDRCFLRVVPYSAANKRLDMPALGETRS